MLYPQAFTSVMQSYNVNHITSSPHYPQSHGLAEKYVHIAKSLFYKVKEEGKDFYKCLMIYQNTSLTGIMKSPVLILQGRNARSDLPMGNAARKQHGIQPQVVRNNDKHALLPMHDLHVGQDVMYQDSTSKHCYPTVNASLCPDPRSYKITTRDGIFTGRHNLIWNLLHFRTRTLTLLSVCHPQWHNLPICSQWNKLSAKSLLQWTIMYKYRQADLNGTLSSQSNLIFKYFSLLNAYWIYIVFHSVYKYTHVSMQ